MESVKKILLISHLADLHGGAERSLLNIAISLSSRGYACTVVVPGRGELLDELEKESIKVVVEPTFWTIIEPERELVSVKTKPTANTISRILSGLYRIIKKSDPDLIVVNTVAIPWAGYVAHELGIPTAIFIREILDVNNGIRAMPNARLLTRNLYNSFDLLVFNSNYTRDSYATVLPTKKASLVLYPTISIPQKYTKATPPLFTRDYLNLIVYGSINEGKNQVKVIQALRQLKRSTKFKLTIMGHGNEKYIQSLRELTKDFSLNNSIKIIPYMKNPIPEILSHDVVIIPSKNEAFGRVTIEGQLLGRLVIGKDAGGTKELISDKKTGLLYNTQNQLSRLLDDIYDAREHHTYTNIAAAGTISAQKLVSDNKRAFNKFLHAHLPTKHSLLVKESVYSPIIAEIVANDDLLESIHTKTAQISQLEDSVQMLSDKLLQFDNMTISQHIKQTLHKHYLRFSSAIKLYLKVNMSRALFPLLTSCFKSVCGSSSERDSLTPVIMCTWKRIDQIHATINNLSDQTTPCALYIWNNNRKERKKADRGCSFRSSPFKKS